MNLLRILALVVVTLTIAPACARDCTAQVKDGWIRLLPVDMPMMAGFGRIENSCGTPVTIVGASSPSFGEVSLHETRIVDGVSRMRAVPELRIAPSGAAVLKPGGLHLMMMAPSAKLKPGSRVVVEFKLKDGGVLRGELEARKPVD